MGIPHGYSQTGFNWKDSESAAKVKTAAAEEWIYTALLSPDSATDQKIMAIAGGTNKVVTKNKLNETSYRDDRDYWFPKSPAERITAFKILWRQLNGIPGRLPRVGDITKIE